MSGALLLAHMPLTSAVQPSKQLKARLNQHPLDAEADRRPLGLIPARIKHLIGREGARRTVAEAHNHRVLKWHVLLCVPLQVDTLL